jgi:hypothetical protein
MFNAQTPTQALSLSFRKQKPTRKHMDGFKGNLIRLVDLLNEKESEEHLKNLVRDFLKDTYYAPNHYLNTKGRNDLVIHTGADATSRIGVIIEAKRPANTGEMITQDNLNARAFQELLLYYLRERITGNNIEIKHLIVTNIHEWFIFDARDFEKLFAQNKKLVELFNDFEHKKLTATDTAFFYNEIAAPAIREATEDSTGFNYTWFDLRNYDTPLRNNDPADDTRLIDLYKIFSPEHLLKLPFANDSNTLDRVFYNELLHIMGLTEVKEGSKKLIKRKPEKERNPGSLLENAIAELDSLDKISRLPNPKQYGETTEEKLFNAGLELVITWVNRILFLKLLEAQLVRYHRGDKAFAFLNNETVSGFDELNSLFFSVLAKKTDERSAEVKQKYAHVPYLNSSLFEPTKLEQATIVVSNLRGDRQLPVLSTTVLRDAHEKPVVGNRRGLAYLFDFLGSYDFGAEGGAEIQEENKTLINAAVLGLIFEKINGYKDGSFFTPGYITMYMCRETIRRAVVQKFNEAKGWDCKTIEDLYNRIGGKAEDRKEANAIVNGLRICDPAVGSGHFLVSALNELIAIKSELKILLDREGKWLKEYEIKVDNDELVVSEEDGQFFQYNPRISESRRVQEALFHEKQTLIENCLFGVDINPNSVKICRLRLWIELLKNAYYTAQSGYKELETLPNIDINIKTGNSLISRFALDADLSTALRKSTWTVETYRTAVAAYKNATDRNEKRTLVKLIEDIKNSFSVEIGLNDPDRKKLEALQYELLQKYNGARLFAEKLTKAQQKDLARMEKELAELEARWEEKKSGRIYDRAFEWRFEFPEVLNDEGDFLGFDVVIGNPPYISSKELPDKKGYKSYQTAVDQFDTFSLFIEKSVTICKKSGFNSLIIPDSFLGRSTFTVARKYLYESTNVLGIVQLDKVFKEAEVASCIYVAHKTQNNENEFDYIRTSNANSWKRGNYQSKKVGFMSDEILNSYKILFINQEEKNILLKIFAHTPLSELIFSWRGEELGKKSELLNTGSKGKPVLAGENIDKYFVKGTSLRIEERLIEKPISEYKKNKIVLRQLGSELHATMDENACITLQTVYNFYSLAPELSNPALLGLINSKLFTYTYQKAFSEKQSFPRILLENLRRLTVPLSPRLEPIEVLVSEILSCKATDPAADTSALEAEIDRLVYCLYGLTDAEIRLVEGSQGSERVS